MKKLLGIAFLFALPVLAFPPKTDNMIRAVVKDQTDLAKLLDQMMKSTEDDQFKSAFDAMTIRRVEFTQELKEQCNNFSRSGAAVQVSFEKNGETTEHLFSTKGSADALEICQ